MIFILQAGLPHWFYKLFTKNITPWGWMNERQQSKFCQAIWFGYIKGEWTGYEIWKTMGIHAAIKADGRHTQSKTENLGLSQNWQ